MKKTIAILSSVFMLAWSMGALARPPSGKNTGVIVKTPSGLSVCHFKQEKRCVDSNQALNDLYPQKGFEALDAFGVVPYKGVVSMVGSIRYADDKDVYAIFLTQLNPFKEGAIVTCHACAPNIGVAIYQFHNGWKLFAKNNNVGEIGSWGRLLINGGKDGVKVVSRGTEKFLIVLPGSYMAQGEITEFQNMIYVAPSGVSSLPPTIKHLGAVTVGEDSCSTERPGATSWTGSVQYAGKYGPPDIYVSRQDRGCTDKQPKGRLTTTKYRFYGKEYIEDKPR